MSTAHKVRFLQRFRRDCKGVAATEFALIAPVLIALYLGSTELSDALIAKSKVESLASTAADLIAQDTSVTDTEMADAMRSLDLILFPYPTSGARVVISSLTYSGPNQGTVAWSDAENGTARTVGSTVSVPSGLISAGGSLIYAEVVYDYVSPVGELLVGTVPLSGEFYSRPRRTTEVARLRAP